MAAAAFSLEMLWRKINAYTSSAEFQSLVYSMMCLLVIGCPVLLKADLVVERQGNLEGKSVVIRTSLIN